MQDENGILWRVGVLKGELKRLQDVEAQVIKDLRAALGEPQDIDDYEGSLCTRPSGRGWPICPFGNPGDPSPHCVVKFRQLQHMIGTKDYGQTR